MNTIKSVLRGFENVRENKWIIQEYSPIFSVVEGFENTREIIGLF